MHICVYVVIYVYVGVYYLLCMYVWTYVCFIKCYKETGKSTDWWAREHTYVSGRRGFVYFKQC